jgi:hypothetical protein
MIDSAAAILACAGRRAVVGLVVSRLVVSRLVVFRLAVRRP